MRLTPVLYFKELKSLFSSWIAYVVLIAFTLLSGLTFYISLEMFQILTKYATDFEDAATRQSWNLIENLIQPFYQTVFVLLFVMVPAITMRLFAEEKKHSTFELLLTSPVKIGEIVIAKYLAAVSLITVMLVPIAIFPAIAAYYGRPAPDWGPMFTGYIGLFLLGYSLAAIGVFASTLTENQVVAFIFCVAMEMLFFIVDKAVVSIDLVRIGDITINLGYILRTFSITEHFHPLLQGLVRATDIVYFISLIVFWLWASRASVESARWG